MAVGMYLLTMAWSILQHQGSSRSLSLFSPLSLLPAPASVLTPASLLQYGGAG